MTAERAANDLVASTNACTSVASGSTNERIWTGFNQLVKAKELVEFKTPTGARIQVYPTLESTAPSAEIEHAFETGKQAVINQKTIPVQEGLVLIAQRLRQLVQFGVVLHEHTNYLNTALFDPANFLNKILKQKNW